MCIYNVHVHVLHILLSIVFPPLPRSPPPPPPNLPHPPPPFPSLQPVGHYTLAGVYLSLREYVAASLHLRVALHSQPAFEHAMSALRLVRCSLKFKEEQEFLKLKVQYMYVHNVHVLYTCTCTCMCEYTYNVQVHAFTCTCTCMCVFPLVCMHSCTSLIPRPRK